MKWTALATSVFFLLSSNFYPTSQASLHIKKPAASSYAQITHQKTSAAVSCKTITCQKDAAPSTPKEETSNDTAFYIKSIPLSLEQQKIIYNTCQEYNVDYTLILAILKVESNFQIHSVNHNTNGTTDSGIAQINSAYYETYASRAHIPLSEFNPCLFQHSIRALCGQINYLANYYQQKDLDLTTKTIYILNSYNMGTVGYEHFIHKKGYISRYYDKKVFEAKNCYDLAF